MLQRNASIALTTRAGGDAFTGSTGRPSCSFRPTSPLIRRLVRPLPQGERDVHCGFAQLIGERTVADGTRQHTANAQAQRWLEPCLAPPQPQSACANDARGCNWRPIRARAESLIILPSPRLSIADLSVTKLTSVSQGYHQMTKYDTSVIKEWNHDLRVMK